MFSTEFRGGLVFEYGCTIKLLLIILFGPYGKIFGPQLFLRTSLCSVRISKLRSEYFTVWTSQLVNNMLLLTNCEVHIKGKYSGRRFELWTDCREVRTKNQDPNIFSYGPNYWLIRAFLYSHNQKSKVFFKFNTEHICVFLECSCWKIKVFPISLSHLNKDFAKKTKTCVNILVFHFVCFN